MNRETKRFVSYSALTAIVIWLIAVNITLRRHEDLSLSNNTELSSSKTIIENTNQNTIVLAIVVCLPPKQTRPRDEALVLIKSVIISAKLNKIRTIEIYFFFENVPRETEYFMKNLKANGYPFENVNLIMHFKSVFASMPEKYRHQFITGTDNFKLLRCTNVRIFLPSTLPNVDSILYLDTDVIVHGNLAELWNMRNLMDHEQLIGISADYERGSDRALWFKHAPFPPPRGLNAGVLLMNLTKMRVFSWESKLLQIWKDYYNDVVNLNDQHLINIMLYFNTDLLFRVPCNFNFMEQHCNQKSACKNAQAQGIQIIHGAAERFAVLGEFRNIYSAYRDLNLAEMDINSKQSVSRYIRKLYHNFQNRSKIAKGKARRRYNSACRLILRQLI